MLFSRASRLATLFAGLFLAFSMVAVDHADARRGGSFGSRGQRTFQSAPPTKTAPQPGAPVERSMTPGTANNAARQPAAGQQKPGFMSGFGGSMMRGLLVGGLIGMLLGQGFGGLAGMFGMLLQVLLIGGAIMLAIRFFRSRPAQSPTMAGAGAGTGAGFGAGNSQARPDFSYRDAAPSDTGRAKSFSIPGIGSGSNGMAQANTSREIELAQSDLETFQQMLTDVQEAFGSGDHAALRRLVTPEMVSFLSEELADNAKNGVRNEVSDVHLLEADIAESWNEEGRDYATAALRYESRDVTRDRATGKVVDGDADHPTETTELWTFTRLKGDAWKLSAIQQA